MDYRVLTVAREYGSGGARIAAIIAERLGWKLLDKNLISEIARVARVDPDLARAYDERLDPWLHRVSKNALWHGAFEGVATVVDTDYFDAETVAALTWRLIEEAYTAGNCVVVGRGAQCVLRDRPGVFHVFVYAPWADRVERIRRRTGAGGDIEREIRATDEERANYVRTHFGQNWCDRRLYNLMVNSKSGCETTASVILCAMG